MKKVLLVAAITLLASSVFCQITYGIKGGINLAQTKDLSIDSKLLIAPNIGIFSNIDFTNQLFIRPELLYSVKGNRFSELGTDEKGKVLFSYITMPILLGFEPVDDLSILFGPEIGYLLSTKSKVPGNSVQNLDYFNDIDFSLNLGIAYQVKTRIGLDARYNYGFKGLYKGMQTDQAGNELGIIQAGAHRLFQISLNIFLNK